VRKQRNMCFLKQCGGDYSGTERWLSTSNTSKNAARASTPGHICASKTDWTAASVA